MARFRKADLPKTDLPKHDLPKRDLAKNERGSALLEFAITLPLLTVLVVGIYDFSDAFNQKQKIEQAAQEGAIIAGAQPMTDIAPSSSSAASSPASLLPVVTAIFNSLAGSGIVQAANCTPPGTVAQLGNSLTWTYKIAGCNSAFPSDNLLITINRGWVPPPASSSGTVAAVGSVVTVQYPYHWTFGNVLQLLFTGPNSYSTATQLTESATVHNQM